MNQEVKTINGYSIKDETARNNIENINNNLSDFDLNRIKTFENVENMKNDTSLVEGMHVKTKGYYSINDGGGAEYYITDTESETEYQEELTNGLYATLIIENNIINLKQFGLKSDDDDFDNSVILNDVFNNDKYTNYSYFIPNGTYYLLNEVIITRNADGFILRGNGHYSDSGEITGTRFIYNGEDFAFTFNQRFWRSLIENFDVIADNGSAFHFIGNIHGTSINEFQFKVKNTGIKAEKSGYSYWNNVNIVDNENSTDFIGFDFSSDNAYVIEYVYLNNCNVGSYSGTYENTYSYGIKSNHLNKFYVEKCDFVGLSYGLYLDAVSNSKYLVITDSNFSNLIGNIYLKADETSIGGVFITECSFGIRQSNGNILITERANSKQIRGLIYENNHIADLQNDVTTDYFISIGNGSIDFDSCIINNNGYNENYTTPFINLPSLYNTYSPLSHSFIRSKIVGVQGDNVKTSYTEILSSDSPFDYRPAIIITDTKGNIDNYSISNTQGGELSVTINFKNAFSDRDYISIHVIGDCMIRNTNI